MISYGDCIGCDGLKCTVCRLFSAQQDINKKVIKVGDSYLLYEKPNDSFKTKSKPIIQYWCSECDALLNKYDKYCHNCGREIDWGDL